MNFLRIIICEGHVLVEYAMIGLVTGNKFLPVAVAGLRVGVG
jgi:hypothetical protein